MVTTEDEKRSIKEKLQKREREQGRQAIGGGGGGWTEKTN